jgi:cytochrome c5
VLSVSRNIRTSVAKVVLVVLASVIAAPNFADSGIDQPVQLAALSEGFDAEAKYMLSCFACHSSGAAGAPIVGNAEEWAPRMEKGMDAVVANAINGLNTMPPRGLCFDCTDDDLVALVEYMVSSSQ